ncbi:MAG: PEP-CTERM sorting domain-containing protein [Planctomycetota bacterium]|nr:PEP-CTERM sorting domain-containing protein [Planctomycetota bacterium]
MQERKMMLGLVAAALSSLSLTGVTSAIPLGGQYSVSTTVTQLGADKYRFAYSITNITDELATTYSGFDILQLVIPTDAIITEVQVPVIYYPEPSQFYWTSVDTPNWDAPMYPHWFDSNAGADGRMLEFMGIGDRSVYPSGTTASLSFVADNVRPGVGDAVIVTYWGYQVPAVGYLHRPVTGEHYTGYLTALTVPVAIPEPATVALLALGGVATLIRRRRRA